MSPAKVPRWIRRPEERPQELLDAAIEVFSTNGYRATRLEQVAEVAYSAQELADLNYVDLHLATDLLRQGCTPELAVRILV